MYCESDAMREIREIRNQIYEEIKDRTPDERQKHLKEEAQKARNLFESKV